MRQVEDTWIIHSRLVTDGPECPTQEKETSYAAQLDCFVLVDKVNRHWRAAHLLQLEGDSASVFCDGEQKSIQCSYKDVIMDKRVDAQEVKVKDLVLRVSSEGAVESAVVDLHGSSALGFEHLHCATMGFDGSEAVALANDLRQVHCTKAA